MAQHSETIKEVTGENFFTQYGGEKFGADQSRIDGHIQAYKFDTEAKVVCFCQQRLGKTCGKCPHAETEDVNEISKIIQEQAKDFIAADKYTAEDLDHIKGGLDKVEFVRS